MIGSGLAITRGGNVIVVSSSARQGGSGSGGSRQSGGSNLLLDDYSGAVVAFSLRKLSTSYSGAAIRVREEGGNTESDINFDSNGDLDLASLSSFCNGSVGRVVTWYDQSSNGNDATQSAAGNQPTIYDGSSVITLEQEPAVAGGHMDLSSTISQTTKNLAYFIVNKQNSGNFAWVLGNNFSNQHNLVLERFGKVQFLHPTEGVIDIAGASTMQMGFPNLIYAMSNNSKLDARVNAIDVPDTSPFTSVPGTIRKLYSRGYGQNAPLTTRFQEIILYQSDQSSNVTGIESNINSKYLIYQPKDSPTSGLLSTYTGAVAAYSVRQLSNKAIFCLKIRRDSDNEERNIGFDSNGDLDTTAISNFCGTANGYVTRWWDQSTNGRNVDQTNSANQPQIYNGTSVITENGKPALKFDHDKLGDVDFSINQPFTSTLVMTSNGGSDTFSTIFGSRDLTGVKGGFIRRTTNWWMQSPLLANTGQAHDTSQHLFYSVWDGANSEFAQDGAAVTTRNAGTVDWTNLSVGTRGTDSPDFGSNGNYQELVIWDSDQSANKSNIETDINNYFSIY
tara:strand:- start:2935 stop:4620 length:1686 start_codon:yes stop_codon:yes gene_type:complete